MASLYPVVGAAIAVAGGDKLIGNRGYKGMFRSLGWSQEGMQAVAAAEIVGGLMMIPKSTRRFGAAVVAAISTVVLISEIRDGDPKLAASRGAVLVAAVAALTAPRA